MDRYGVVEWGGPLNVPRLLAAYEVGVFPWPIDAESDIPWVCPARRAILPLDRLAVPRSLRQARAKTKLRFTVDAAFPRVIEACARAPRPGQRGTWLLPEMIEAYVALHRAGHAHSVEAWEGDALVGGVYGVEARGVFSGESMFHERANASKLALLELLDRLRARGASFMDIQQLTPHMAALGAVELTRAEFLKRLAAEQERGLSLFGA